MIRLVDSRSHHRGLVAIARIDSRYLRRAKVRGTPRTRRPRDRPHPSCFRRSRLPAPPSKSYCDRSAYFADGCTTKRVPRLWPVSAGAEGAAAATLDALPRDLPTVLRTRLAAVDRVDLDGVTVGAVADEGPAAQDFWAAATAVTVARATCKTACSLDGVSSSASAMPLAASAPACRHGRRESAVCRKGARGGGGDGGDYAHPRGSAQLPPGTRRHAGYAAMPPVRRARARDHRRRHR